MSSKRTRVVRSSSTGEFGLLNVVKPIESPVAPWEKKRATAAQASSAKPVQKAVEDPKVSVPVPERPTVKDPKVSAPVPEMPRRSILTFGSPVRENDGDGSGKKPDERFGAFLEVCYLCKKKLAQDEDTYMYGGLRAFCTPECRDDQIALDGIGRKPSPIAEAFKVTKEPVKRVFGSRVKRPSIARFK